MKVATLSNTMELYNELDSDNKHLVDDFIHMILSHQRNNAETVQVIKDADEGIGLSEEFDNVDDLMVALNAED